MNKIELDIEALSAEQRALLDLCLKEEGMNLSVLPLEPQRRERGSFPLSFAQQGLWFLDQLTPNSSAYNCPSAMRLEGRLDLEILESVINDLLKRHETLRTRIEVEDGSPVQVIDEWRWRSLEVQDLTNLTGEEREVEIKRITRAEARTEFDLRQGPLMRVKVLKLGTDEHVMLLTMHHIICDAWSMGVLLRESCLLYEAMSEGRRSPLTELEIQYGDYAVWQGEYLAGRILEDQLEYWKKQLKGAAVMDLPTDHARPAVPSYRGSTEKVYIGKELSEDLKRLGQLEEATLFMTLMAAFKALLMRYSGGEDLSVGTSIAGRTQRRLEGMVGYFVNTLVMRTNLGGNPSFRELVNREKDVALEAYARQEAPFEKLVEEINPERDLSRNPLFQVMMVLQNTRQDRTQLKGLKVTKIEEAAGVAKFDLTLELAAGPEGITGCLEYSRDLYEEETIRRMARHYERVVKEAARDAERGIREIDLMSAAEKRQITETWNNTEQEYREARLAHELIAEQARRNGDAIALRSRQGELSYLELNRRANRLGNYLRKKGIGCEHLVGICADRSMEMVIAILGVLKAGGAYVPMDGNYPRERVRYMLEDASVTMLLTQGESGARLKAENLTVEVFDLETQWTEIDYESEVGPDVKADEANMAYVIYTSGSTGKPKGVMITHGGLANYLKWATDAYRIGEGEGAPVQSSIGFDLTVTSLYAPLVNGKRVELLSEQEGSDALANALSQERGYSLVKITPAHLEVLAEQMKTSDVEGRTRALVIGGEELKAGGLKHWQERARGTRLINEYGPTETVVGCCVYEVEAGKLERERETIPIGKPIANAKMYILDENLEPAPIGVRGEICISGVGLARGYMGQPALTAERFIPNGFCKKGGGRLYRTGDVGRYLSEGNLEFIGRADRQVKIHGYRIEPGEIEVVLCQHPAIREAIVIAAGDDQGDKRLIAYLVYNSGHNPLVSDLREFLRERLPNYLIPSAMVGLDALPLTSNGKVDRNALPPPKQLQTGYGKTVALPRDILEVQLAHIWKEILDIEEQISITDNFFELGGHSIRAIRLMAQIVKWFGQKLPLSILFQGGTIEHLANVLRGQASVVRPSPLVAIQPRGSKTPFFCVHTGSGEVLAYEPWARYLGKDQPFYGLQDHRAYQEDGPGISLYEMAADYVEAIRSVQPQGPYLLGGWSFGGLVAFEMAQQLTRLGQKIAMLLLVDAASPAFTKKSMATDDAMLLAIITNQLTRSTLKGNQIRKLVMDLRELGSEEQLKYVLSYFIDRQEADKIDPEYAIEYLRRQLRIMRSRIRVGQAYEAQCYHGKITLFRPLDEPDEFKQLDPTRGWGALSVEPVEIHFMPGNHQTMGLEPHADALAERLRICLEKSQVSGAVG